MSSNLDEFNIIVDIKHDAVKNTLWEEKIGLKNYSKHPTYGFGFLSVTNFESLVGQRKNIHFLFLLMFKFHIVYYVWFYCIE